MFRLISKNLMNMNILFINYYPTYRLDKDQTHHSIEYFINPLFNFFEQQGHTINQINIEELNILPCIGCSHDPFFVPMDYCRQDDDMNRLYPILRSSDFWFFNIVINQKHLPKQLCNFLDRLEPLFDKDESILLSEGNGHKVPNQGYVYLLATSEYWGNDVFQELVQEIQTIAFLFNRQYVGELLRPHLGVYVQRYILPNFTSFNQSINKLGSSIISNNLSNSINGSDLTQFVIDKDEFENNFAKFVF